MAKLVVEIHTLVWKLVLYVDEAVLAADIHTVGLRGVQDVDLMMGFVEILRGLFVACARCLKV